MIHKIIKLIMMELMMTMSTMRMVGSRVSRSYSRRSRRTWERTRARASSFSTTSCPTRSGFACQRPWKTRQKRRGGWRLERAMKVEKEGKGRGIRINQALLTRYCWWTWYSNSRVCCWMGRRSWIRKHIPKNLLSKMTWKTYSWCSNPEQRTLRSTSNLKTRSKSCKSTLNQTRK